jgi:lipopolysaccharide heptosyltransferase I
MKKTPKILIIKPSSLGDIIHALPALSIIRKSFPASYLAWLVSDPFKGLLEGHPYLDEIISFPRHFFLQKGLPFLKELRSRQFDIVIDLQGLLRSALIGFLCRAEERIGFREGREFSPLFYTRPITIGRHILHAVDRNMQLASSISGGIFEADFTFNLSPRAVKKVEGKLKELKIEGEIIALNPATRWPSKRWKEDNWAKIAEALANEGNIFFLAGPGEEELIEGIRKLMKKNSFSLAGQLSLQELAVFLSRSRLLVTVDSGPMHLAAAMHIPLVALFGPTDPARCGPYGHSRSVIKSSLDCTGCYRFHCRSNKCMNDIAPGQVLAKAVEILKRKGR